MDSLLPEIVITLREIEPRAGKKGYQTFIYRTGDLMNRYKERS